MDFRTAKDKLVDIMVEANYSHPFPEGNGRSLQVFEPPRVSRRPNFLREYPNEKYLLT